MQGPRFIKGNGFGPDGLSKEENFLIRDAMRVYLREIRASDDKDDYQSARKRIVRLLDKLDVPGIDEGMTHQLKVVGIKDQVWCRTYTPVPSWDIDDALGTIAQYEAETGFSIRFFQPESHMPAGAGHPPALDAEGPMHYIGGTVLTKGTAVDTSSRIALRDAMMFHGADRAIQWPEGKFKPVFKDAVFIEADDPRLRRQAPTQASDLDPGM